MLPFLFLGLLGFLLLFLVLEDFLHLSLYFLHLDRVLQDVFLCTLLLAADEHHGIFIQPRERIVGRKHRLAHRQRAIGRIA
jgi:hypothetical protein